MEKTVLITGGSRGIGTACVETFALAGYRVAFTYNRHQSAAMATAARVQAQLLDAGFPHPQERILALPLDLGKEDAGAALRETARQALIYFGAPGFDACVANAGISGTELLDRMPEERLRRVINVDLVGAILTCRTVIPRMIERKEGAIVLLSSVWGQRAAAGETVYAAAKAGLIGFGKSLAAELGPSGIRVNLLCPGVIDTDMNAEHTPETLKDLAGKTPLMRLGEPREVAEAALFLCGSGASFITGQVLGIDGGFGI
ncbi:MAG: SDR family oxidoreductase [Firmicutes bacterium]|nr:SDR family oxidoreductase [Bacillota bacterium]